MITTRRGLIDYCLRALGQPVIQINVAPEQIEDRVDEALHMFWEFHGEGTEKTYIAHKLTQKEITNKNIELPDEILTVIRVLPFNNSISSYNLQFQAYMTDVLGAALRGSSANYLIAQQYLNTIQSVFNSEKSIRFNRITHQLRLDTDWAVFKPDDFIIIECFSAINPEDWEEVYNNAWLKEYTTALIKKQWGTNLSKYNGFQLPSGMTLDGATILQSALQEIQNLEEELRSVWSLPVDFAVG